MFLITILFSFLRPHNNVVYAPKIKHADSKHAPPVIGRGLLAWMKPTLKCTEEDIVDKAGLDAAIFLRFTRMLRNIFAVISVFGCGILIPVHVISAGNLAKDFTFGNTQKAFPLMTPQFTKGNPMWSHVAYSWLFDITVLGFIYINYRAVARLRKQYFASSEYQQSLHSRSVMVTDIPAPDRSDEGILRILDSVEETAGQPRAAIARNVKELPKMIEEHTETVKKLESVLAKYLKNPDKLPAERPTLRPSKRDRNADHSRQVDAIDYLTARVQHLADEINTVRESVDKRNAMPYGFATYEQIIEAHSVAFTARKKHPRGTTIRLAPKPNDLIWDNLPLSKATRGRNGFFNNLWVALLTLIWIAPNALIAIFLTNLANLANIWQGFKTSYDGNKVFWAAVQAILAPALTSLVYLVLPIIFRRLSIKAGDLTKTQRERHVTAKLYAFFVFNNLIIFSVFSALWTFLSTIIQASQQNRNVWDAITNEKLAYNIMVTLCLISPFWLTWLLQRNLGAAIDLVQLINLVWVWFARTFLSPTPRQNIEWTAPPPFDYASYYNSFLFYTTVGLCYATLQPLVLPITAFYFCVDSFLKKYLLLYIFITKTESGGQFWNMLINRLLFATLLANCVAAIVIKAALGSWSMIWTMAPLPFLLLAFKIYTFNTIEQECKYFEKTALKDPEALAAAGQKQRRTDRVAVRFGHPALFKPLITPMVHAKAQHLLSQVYRGHLPGDVSIDTDGASIAPSYSDIALETLSASGEPGKKSRNRFAKFNPKKFFELVPEANLDFAFFKNRAEFSEEHGGDGELYARPQDPVSERSATPKSFLADPLSRSSSPVPGMQPTHHYRNTSMASSGSNDGSVAGVFNPIPTRKPAPKGIYDLGNESERTLLSEAAAPMGTSPEGETPGVTPGEHRYGPGAGRWRVGDGYFGVPNPALGEEGTGYEAYRPRKQ